MTGLIAAPTIDASRGLDEPTGVTGYLYRMMTRTMDGVVLFDDVGRIVFANAAFGRLVGIQASRLVRQSFLGLLRESERPMVLLRWRRLSHGQEDSYRVHLIPSLGDRLLVVVQHRIEQGTNLHLAYVRDLTESTELSRQMHELTGLTSIARAFASITDPRQVTSHLVTELAQLLGVEKCYISRYDPVTDMVEPLVPAVGIAESDLPALRIRLAECGHLSQIAQTGQPRISNDAARDPLLSQRQLRALQISSLLTVPLTSGRRILGFINVINRYGAGFHEDDVRPLLIFAGQVAVVLDNARLVSELAGEKDLAVARAGQLEALINSIVDGVFIVRADGSVVTVNAAGRRLTGLSHDDVLRPAADYLTLLRLRRLDDMPAEEDDLPWRRSLAGETVQNQELLLRGHGRSSDTIISVSSAPVYTVGGTVALAVVVARDVTEVRDLQRQKDEFLSIASHELRTPLTTLRGYTQQVLRMLQRDALDRDRAIRNLELVMRQVDRLAGLAGDLVDVSRLETGQLRVAAAPCDLVTVAGEVLDRCRAGTATPRHRLVLTADGPVVGAWDAARLEQVLANLIGNAIKYSPEGGTVEVRVWQDGASGAVSVRDEGIGIPTDKLPHLFQAFYRVEHLSDRNAPGLGLGLHIAHELVRLHGGTITAQSQPGKGSLFTVMLPLAPDAG
ncbi:MAG: PAS domain-containing protein [Chloroflexi bacterium]|nr:PAS domain-containing protein [Chloroflexota bacterium]